MPDPPLDFLREILHRFRVFIEEISKKRGFPVPTRLNLSGGEPFLHENLFELLEDVRSTPHFSRGFAILSNGTFINRTIAKRLSVLKPVYVQVSLDGMEKTHDSIRGEGSFQKAAEGIRNLVRYRIPVSVSFTVNRSNRTEFSELAMFLAKLRVHRLWSDRMIPCGRKFPETLSAAETRTFFEEMYSARTSLRTYWDAWKAYWEEWFKYRIGFPRTEIAMHRALQFLIGGGEIYKCTAGRSLLAVLPDGTVLPCRRMPVPIGKLPEGSLFEIYENSELLKRLRDEPPRNEKCTRCVYLKWCSGGLRCLAWAETGDPLSGDPGCWI